MRHKISQSRKTGILRLALLLLVFTIATASFAQSDPNTATEANVNPAVNFCPPYPGGLIAPYKEIADEDDHFGFGIQYLFYPTAYHTYYGVEVFGIQPNTPNEMQYHLQYVGGMAKNETDDLPVRYYLLIDEEFIPLGEEGKLYRDALLPYDEVLLMKVDIPALEVGVYDYLVLMIANPEIDQLPEEPSAHSAIWTLSRRATLVVSEPLEAGDTIPFESDQRSYVTHEGPYWDDLERGFPSVTIMTKEGAHWRFVNQPDYIMQLPENTEYKSEIRFGPTGYWREYPSFENPNPPKYSPNNEVEMAFIVLQDYEPIAIAAGNENETVYYAHLPEKTEYGSLALNITTPDAGQYSNLIVIRIDFPGISICEAGAGVNRISAQRVYILSQDD